MSEIPTFRLENRTKFSSYFRPSDFRHSGCWICSIVQLWYKHPKSKLFGNWTTLESAKIRTFGFQTLTVHAVAATVSVQNLWNWECLKSGCSRVQFQTTVTQPRRKPRPLYNTLYNTDSLGWSQVSKNQMFGNETGPRWQVYKNWTSLDFRHLLHMLSFHIPH